MLSLDNDSIFHFKPDPAKRKQPNNPFALSEQLAPGQQYDRVKNHIILGQLCDFVPQVVIPDDSVLRQAKAKGELTLERLDGLTVQDFFDNKNLTVDEFLKIVEVCFLQFRFLYERYGILLSDRSLSNAMLCLNGHDKGQNITVQGQQYQVYQIDLEEIRDITGEGRSNLTDFKQFDIADFQLSQAGEEVLHNELVTFVSSIWEHLNRLPVSSKINKPACFKTLFPDVFKLRNFNSVAKQLEQLRETIEQ